MHVKSTCTKDVARKSCSKVPKGRCFYPQVWWFPKGISWFWGGSFSDSFWYHEKTRIYVHYDLWIQWIKANQRLVTTQSKYGGWCSGKPTCLNYPPENIKVKECNMRKKNAYLQQMEFGWQSWNNIYSLLTFRYGLVGLVKWSFQRLSELQLQ